MPAQSKQQQKFMGIVRSIQKGDQPASKFSKKAQDAADDMKEKDVEKFASTKHKGLPKKVEQALREKIRTMVEDYVESCGYVVSAKDPNYKLKSPGGTGEEDRKLKEEGFGSDEFLTKTEKKKFEKERLENAEVLGYTLTGKKDIKEAITGSARKNLLKIGKEIKNNLFRINPGLKKVKDNRLLIRGLANTFMFMRYTPDNANYQNYKKYFPKNFKSSSVQKLANILQNEKDTVRKTFFKQVVKESINESKKEKDQIIKYLQGLGFNQRTAKNAVAKSYNYISKAYRNTGTRYKGDLIARILNKKESVFAVRQDKIKNGERFPKEPNFNYDPEKGKSRIRKVNEGKGVDKIMKMADDYSYGKIAGKTVDVMTAKLFQAVYKKASQKARDRVDKMNEKQLYIFMMNLWKKFGKQLRLASYNPEKVNEASVSQVRSTLSRVKKQLMKKWAKKGGYENFGQKELRALKSKFKENPYGSPQERQISKMLGAFNNWAMNYSGDMRESVNEMTTSQAKDTLNHLGGKRFMAMTGAKPLTIDKKRKELLFKIGRNAKGINLVTIRLTSLDLYDMEFAQVRMGNKKIKAVEKRVYGDQLQKFFKKHTGMNTYL